MRSRDQSRVNWAVPGADLTVMEGSGMHPRRKVASAVLGLVLFALLGSLLPLSPAAARSLRQTGPCTGSASWKLSVDRSGGKLGVTFKVTGATPRSRWTIFMDDNGSGFFAGSRTATSRGRFRVADHTSNLPGPDTIVAAASDRATGETCIGRLTF